MADSVRIRRGLNADLSLESLNSGNMPASSLENPAGIVNSYLFM